MKLYTRKGDDGTTSLLTGDRVSKAAARLEVEGTLDELSACLGAAAAHLQDAELRSVVQELQSKLFAVGAVVAGAETLEGAPALTEADTGRLEELLDQYAAELPALSGFLLPGGSPAGAHLHVARTVCRRLERRLVALADQDSVPGAVLSFVNRLSDLLFVLARTANHRAGTPERLGQPDP